MEQNDFTTGSIPKKLIQFMIPILGALILQAMYGAVDVMVVGHFGTSEGLSGVSTGTCVTNLFVFTISGFSMGLTVLIGRCLGEKRTEPIGKAIGGAICLFLSIALVLAVLLVAFARPLSVLMQAPKEAVEQTATYVRICGGGMIFIIAYNVISAVMRGLGDSKSPLLFVAIACVVNIFGDLLFVAVLKMDVAGAALATVMAQAVSVILSILILLKRDLPFTVTRADVCFNAEVGKFFKIGFPIAFQEILTSLSFLALCAFINRMGLNASAGYAVANKVTNFVCLVPSALMQSLASFVSQNVGAGREDRAKKALGFQIAMGIGIGIVVAAFIILRGELVSAVFSNKPEVIAQAADYLKGFGVEAVVTAIMFSFVGYYNGHAKTGFVMFQGIAQSFIVRLPMAYFMSIRPGANLTGIGLAAPSATIFGILLNLGYYIYLNKAEKL